jgi:hypothetical protein
MPRRTAKAQKKKKRQQPKNQINTNKNGKMPANAGKKEKKRQKIQKNTENR